jgi:pyruvate dehydrogenase (quinone)/pyruvate oxidase
MLRDRGVARACGGAGFTIEDPGQCGDILDRAFGCNGPAVIEAVVDPNEPPLPPFITARQAAHFAESLAKGAPDGRKSLEMVMGNKVRELL